jgi:dihydropteroate synthase
MKPVADPFAATSWTLAHGRSLELGPASVIMGILNVTPDSFSDGGRFADPARALDRALQLVQEGAAIVDIGGESTRPGATPVDARTEMDRVLPVIAALAGRSDVAISIDTWRAQTARAAIVAGAHIVNDVWGLQRDPDMADAIARSGAGCVLMHTGRERRRNDDVFADQESFLSKSLELAAAAGIAASAIVLDPGFGFAKETRENLRLLAGFERLAGFGRPLLAGTSRKRFIGAVTGRDEGGRDIGTVATNVVARLKGAAVFRVHDVAAHRDALAMADAILTAGRP